MRVTDDPFYRGLMGTVFAGPMTWTVADLIIAGRGSDHCTPEFYTEEEKAWARRVVGKREQDDRVILWNGRGRKGAK